VEEGRKTTPPSSSSTSRVLGFSDPGFQNLDILLDMAWPPSADSDRKRWRGLSREADAGDKLATERQQSWAGLGSMKTHGPVVHRAGLGHSPLRVSFFFSSLISFPFLLVFV
jgi:hypothetical protein